MYIALGQHPGMAPGEGQTQAAPFVIGTPINLAMQTIRAIRSAAPSPEARTRAWYDLKNALLADFDWLYTACMPGGRFFCDWDAIRRPDANGQNVLSNIADKTGRLKALKAEVESVYPNRPRPLQAQAVLNGVNGALDRLAALYAQLAACEDKFRNEHNGWTWEQWQAKNIVDIKVELKAPVVGAVGSKTWGVSANKGFTKKLEGLSYLCVGR